MDEILFNRIKKYTAAYITAVSLSVVGLFLFPDYQDNYPLTIGSLLYLIIFLGGLYLFGVRKEMIDLRRKERFLPLISSISLIMIGLGLYFMNDTLYIGPPGLFVPLLDHLTLILLHFTSIMALTNLFFYSKDLNKTYLSFLSEKVLDLQMVIVLIGASFSYYFLHLRNILAEDIVSPIIYGDWIVIILFGMIFISVFWNRIESIVLKEEDIDYGKSHQQDIVRYVDKKLRELENIQKDFVENGKKEYLLIYLIDLIRSNVKDMNKKKVSLLLRPLINYHDRSIPDLSFKWWKKRIKEKNIRERKKVLEMTMNNVSSEIESDDQYKEEKD